MSEDIEAKIRRLRELGKATIEQEQPAKPVKPPVTRPPRRVSKIGSLRERERKRRIMIGAAIVIIILLAISVAVYTYYQNRAVRELEQAKQQKIAEVNRYFTGELANDTAKFELIKEIQAARSIEELNKIDVKKVYEERLAELQRKKEEEARKKAIEELNKAKAQQISVIEQAFEPLLAQPLPEDLKNEAIQKLNQLKQEVESAQSKDQVLAVDPVPYLLDLWKKYYYYLIDSIPTQKVILKRGEEKRIYTKVEAKYVVSKITNLNEILQYTVEKAEMVQIALVLTRDSINGAFLSPGDKIKIYARNGTKGKYIKIADEGYVDLILLPTTAGQISLSESQSEGSTVSTSSTTSYSESHSTSYTPGDTTITTAQDATDQYSTAQSSSDSSSAYYNYNVNLAEVLKAIAAGKIQAPDDVKEQLSKYGWKILDLEKDSGMLVLDPTAKFLVIIEVPAEFVTDILNYKDMIYIARITG
ncbi:DUF515 domain-containing protein [Thermococcus sp. M39]|uniref:DUF515 domain-containing protein n=1 Tax=Thermococcus sp. M39 TaxID=1638262 RepID=UPI00143B1FA0|nr:DUF515 domain-containing protein [Thermococcus sp. M39]NJE11917.1 DUF515 domain-containing protein [Thermococcus sp. LS2]